MLSVFHPHDETPALISTATAQGITILDMEASFIARRCEEHALCFAAIGIVSDLIDDTWQPGFSMESVRGALRRCLETIRETQTS